MVASLAPCSRRHGLVCLFSAFIYVLLIYGAAFLESRSRILRRLEQSAGRRSVHDGGLSHDTSEPKSTMRVASFPQFDCGFLGVVSKWIVSPNVYQRFYDTGNTNFLCMIIWLGYIMMYCSCNCYLRKSNTCDEEHVDWEYRDDLSTSKK